MNAGNIVVDLSAQEKVIYNQNDISLCNVGVFSNLTRFPEATTPNLSHVMTYVYNRQSSHLQLLLFSVQKR